ncbi:MAG: lysoplasmalogenase [Anaerolineales bacterium]|nr:lysoplasmalogenase [Anaerolineales bacterium]
MRTIFLSLLGLFSATSHIRAEYCGPRQHVYLFKPLTMVFIILTATLGGGVWPFYKSMIVAGLVFSLVGDVLLMLPSNHFLAGLAAFLTAHLFYIAAFSSDISGLIVWPIIPLAAGGIFVYMIVAPALTNLKIPVLIYILVILIMAWLAWERWNQTRTSEALLAASGAILFMISDAILAINRFHGPFKPAHGLNLVTYYAAQWMIASSVGI